MNRRPSSLQRPFRVVFNHSEQQCEARLHVVFKELLGPARETVVRLFFGELVAFVASGALTGDRIHPGLIQPAAEPVSISAVTATQAWTNLALPLEAITSLLNMLEWLHYHEAPILEAQVQWDMPVLPATASSASFPPGWPMPGFPLHIQNPRRFDIEIEFRGRHSLDELDRVVQEIGSWFAAVNRGAYGDAQIPPATSCLELSDEAVELTTERLVMYIDRFHANPAAIQGLSNLLERVHRRLIPIARVRLG